MRLKYILFAVLFSYVSSGFAQVVGTPMLFDEGKTEFELGFNYNLKKIDSTGYLYTLLPILNNNIFDGDVIWTSSNEFAATINQKGEVTLKDPFAPDGVTFTAEINEGIYKGLKAKQFNELMSQGEGGGFTNLTGAEIIVNKEIYQRSVQPIAFILYPSGNRDNSTFGVSYLYSVSDESIATIKNGKIYGHKPGTVTVTGTSSVDGTLTASKEVTVLFKADETKPAILIEGYKGEDFIKMQRKSTNKIPTATAEDIVDGVLPVTIKETGTAFNGEQIGEYPIEYSAKDAANNEEIVLLTLKVVDTVAPTLSLTDTALQFEEVITAKQGEGLTIPEVTAVDDNGDVITVNINDNGFDPDVIGRYKIIYTATDASGNSEERAINLTIDIGNPPSLTITGYENNAVISIDQNQSFDIPKATAIDALGNEVAVEIIDQDEFDYNKPGIYVIKYKTIDRFDLVTEKQLQIKVKDIVAPKITNAQDFQYLQRFLTGTPSVVTKVEATDNVGVVSYTINEMNSLTASYIHDVSWYTQYYKGTINIANDGTITATVPTQEDFTFRHEHYFRIEAIDADGNKSEPTYLTLSHITEEQPEIKVKEYKTDSFSQINFDNVGNLSHKISKQENFKVNDTLAIFNANIPDYTFERYELTGAGANNFDTSDLTNDTLYLTLKNSFDTSVTTEYNLNLNVYAKLNPTDPEKLFPVILKIKVDKIVELAPSLPEIQDVIVNSASVTPDPVSGQKKVTLNNIIKANNGIVPNANVIGEALLAFNEDLLKLIILASEQDPIKVGKFLPYFVWFKKEGSITRVFAKFQKGPTAIQIELISNKATSDTYWMMNIGSSAIGAGIQPSRTFHSSLAFLDHMEGNIVFTNTTITKANFKYLTLVTNDVLTAGIHMVAKGPLQPQPIPVNPFTNPIVEARIGVPEAGWTVPDLVVKLGLDGRFLTKFDIEIAKYLIQAADVAKQGIVAARKKITDAKENIKKAEVVFNKAKYPVRQARDVLNSVSVPGLESTKRWLEKFKRRKKHYANLSAESAKKQLCGNPCIPYAYPKMCYRKVGFVRLPYPCGIAKGLKCFKGCIPDPKGLAEAALYALAVAEYQALIVSYQASLAVLKESLRVAKIPLEQSLKAAEVALDQAKKSLDAAKLALTGFEQALIATEAGYGELGKIAVLMLDKLPRLAESSNVTFETTLAVANSGTIKGKMGFQFKFKGASPIGKKIDFNFSDPAGSAINFAQSLIQ